MSELKKKTRQWLSLAIAFVMMLGIMPAAAIAEEETQTTTEVSTEGYTHFMEQEEWETWMEKNIASVYLGTGFKGHLQGFVTDSDLKYFYASFTHDLVKVDIDTGEIVGRISNFWGHLGDLTYYDGKLYSAMSYDGDFWICVFECDKLVGEINCRTDEKAKEVMTQIHQAEPYKDRYATDDEGNVMRNYGVSGTGNLTIGRAPDTGDICLMVGYSIKEDTDEVDDDHDYQVLTQYNLNSFLEPDGNGGTQIIEKYRDFYNTMSYERLECDNKYFVYTGNTAYGIQVLEYDSETNQYVCGMYPGTRPEFTRFYMYHITCNYEYKKLEYLGKNAEDYAARGLDYGNVLELAQIGELGKDGVVWGSKQNPLGGVDTGIDHVFGDYFFFSESKEEVAGSDVWTATALLYKYDRENDTYERVKPKIPAKKLLSYSMDKADIYTDADGITRMKNGVDNTKYSAIVEGTYTAKNIAGNANKSRLFKSYNWPDKPDQVYLDEETIEYLNDEIEKAQYGYSYSFWMQPAGTMYHDSTDSTIMGFFHADGTNASSMEFRNRKNVYHSVHKGTPGSYNETKYANPDSGYVSDVSVQMGNGAGATTAPQLGSGLGDKRWYNITVVECNGSTDIYVNGVKAALSEVTVDRLKKKPIADVIFGGGAWNVYQETLTRGRYHGSIDDIEIYSGILTESEISDIYNRYTYPTSHVMGFTRAVKQGADTTDVPSDNIVYAAYDKTADAGESISVDSKVSSPVLSGLTTGSDYTVSGSTVTFSADYLAELPCGIKEWTVSGVTLKLTVTDRKVPVLNYKLNSASLNQNTVADSSVYGVDAVANNITTFGKNHVGTANGAMFFNGLDYKNPNYVKLSTDNAAWLNSVLRDGYTISFRAQPQAENGNKMAFAGLYANDARPLGVVETNYSDAPATHIDTEGTDGKLTVQADMAEVSTSNMLKSKYTVKTSTDALNVGDWSMYTISYDKAAGTLKLYIDGVKAAESEVEDSIIGNISRLFIGHTYRKFYTSYNSSTNPVINTDNITPSNNFDNTKRAGFYGLMNDFSVYNYALSDAEIAALAADAAIESYDAAEQKASVISAAAGTATLVFADYEGGVLSNIDLVPVTLIKGVNVIAQEKLFALGKDDKIMLWENMSTLKPICKELVIAQ